MTFTSGELLSISSAVTNSLPNMETILLVENEAAVVRVVEMMLKKLGYKVLVAHDGVSALQLATQYAEEIHLLLTDILMKPLSGIQTANCILQIRPTVKIIFISTDTFEFGITKHFPLLQKPFTIEELSDKLRKVLDNSRLGL